MALVAGQQALMQARSGVARAAATRADYLTTLNVIVTVYKTITDGAGNVLNVVPIDISPYIMDLSISKRLNDEIDTASFTVQPFQFTDIVELRAGEMVEIALGSKSNLLFAGQAMQVVTRYQPGVKHPYTEVLCTDWMDLFDSKFVTMEVTSQSATTALQYVVEQFTAVGAFDASGIQPNMPTITSMPVTNQRPSTVFRNICTQVGGGFVIEPTRIVRAWAKDGAPAWSPPQTLTLGLASLKQLTVTQDATQVRTRVYIEGKRTTTPLGIPANGNAPETQPIEIKSLPVDDTSFFPVATGQQRVRIGTQVFVYADKDKLNPLLNPPGTTVITAHPPGATTLWIQQSAPFRDNWLSPSWFKVGGQLIRAETWAGTIDGACYLHGIPATGYGSIQAEISDGAEIVASPFLWTVLTQDPDDTAHPQTGLNYYPPIHAQSPGQAVVQRTLITDGAARNQWKGTIPVGDGWRDSLVQDGRLSQAGASARGTAELAAFGDPLWEIAWETDDMNADVGRPQATNLPYVNRTFVISEVSITFPIPNGLPRRQCRGTESRAATILDVLLTEATQEGTRMPITRSTWIDDDGTGKTGTVINNAELQKIYNNVDAGIVSSPLTMCTTTASGTQHNFNPGIVGNTLIQNSGSSPITITGFAPTIPAYPGQIIRVFNWGALINFANTNGGSASKNQLFNFVQQASTLVAGCGFATYIYNGDIWVLMGHEQGAWISPPFNAANFTGTNGMTWTVSAGNVEAYAYRLTGRTLHWSVALTNGVIGGTPSHGLVAAVPGGFITARVVYTAYGGMTGGVALPAGVCIVSQNGSSLTFLRDPLYAAWSTGPAYVMASGACEVI